MGRLLHPYNPAIYKEVPHFDSAIKKADDLGVKEKLNQLGQVFVKHNTFRDFGLIIIHRHFELEDNEVLVDTISKDKLSSIAMPWKIQGKDVNPSPCEDDALWKELETEKKPFIHPMTWTFINNKGIEPFEFHCGEYEVEPMPSSEFVQDLFNELKLLGLESVIGLRRYNPKSWESTPPGLRANILHFTEIPNEVLHEMTTVMWTFNEHGKFSVNGECGGHQCCGHSGGCGCHR